MQQTASDIMTTKLVLLHPADRVPHIAAVLNDHHISAAPVVDTQGRLLGMVSEGDLMRPLGAKIASRRAWWLDMLAEGEDLAPDFVAYLRHNARVASELMTKSVVTVTPETQIEDIVDLLARHGIKRVPVMKDGRIIGIVSRADIIRTLSRER
jgi:CBS domain-containing protein